MRLGIAEPAAGKLHSRTFANFQPYSNSGPIQGRHLVLASNRTRWKRMRPPFNPINSRIDIRFGPVHPVGSPVRGSPLTRP
jgi:hypothetical protein